VAYSLYAATTTFLPSVVVAVVLFYGGTLVLNGEVREGCQISGIIFAFLST
jgi:hypothetical protein